ncbi:hypothetical protein BG261_02915 [Floricoccus tropicus]|uniref:Uncharacterized protein n=1 Tax=Floricoccus tropicus TaxID=1859473 RepID=A0A1E8GNG9_9LACT|nr:hypothetical protein [Floricoccus tropicus]OFI49546.1 hypothetical protein BG261_02915 [Floricoccus tropicus]
MINASEARKIVATRRKVELKELSAVEELSERIKHEAENEKCQLIIYKKYDNILFQFAKRIRKELESKGFGVYDRAWNTALLITWTSLGEKL